MFKNIEEIIFLPPSQTIKENTNYDDNSKIITEIRKGAFKNCDIDTFNFSESLKIIDDWAFANNNFSNELNIPSNIQYIGKYSFFNNNIKNLNIEDGVTNINEYAFSINEIENIRLPSTINKLSNHVFANNKLTIVDLPENIEIIDDYAFNDNSISKLIIRTKNLKKLGNFSFTGKNKQNKIQELELYNSDNNIIYFTGNFNKCFTKHLCY